MSHDASIAARKLLLKMAMQEVAACHMHVQVLCMLMLHMRICDKERVHKQILWLSMLCYASVVLQARLLLLLLCLQCIVGYRLCPLW
jgi:hypothetical protein